jgi:hypothetical protein
VGVIKLKISAHLHAVLQCARMSSMLTCDSFLDQFPNLGYRKRILLNTNYATRWRPYHAHMTARSRLAAAIIVSYYSLPSLKPVVKFNSSERESCHQKGFFFVLIY